MFSVSANISHLPCALVSCQPADELMGMPVSEGCHLMVFMVWRDKILLQAQCSKQSCFSEAA